MSSMNNCIKDSFVICRWEKRNAIEVYVIRLFSYKLLKIFSLNVLESALKFIPKN